MTKETSVNLSDESIKEISAAESFNSGEEASTITSGTEKKYIRDMQSMRTSK